MVIETKKVDNPLVSQLGSPELAKLMTSILNHPSIVRLAKGFGFEIDELSGPVFEALIERAPKECVRSIPAWLFRNVKEQVRQTCIKEIQSRLTPIEDNSDAS